MLRSHPPAIAQNKIATPVGYPKVASRLYLAARHYFGTCLATAEIQIKLHR